MINLAEVGANTNFYEAELINDEINLKAVIKHIEEVPNGKTAIVGKTLQEAMFKMLRILGDYPIKVKVVDGCTWKGRYTFDNGHEVFLSSHADSNHLWCMDLTGLYVLHHEKMDKSYLRMLKYRQLRGQSSLMFDDNGKETGIKGVVILF